MGADHSRREDLRRIFSAAVEAVEPGRLVRSAVARTAAGIEIAVSDRVVAIPAGAVVGVFGAGKAAGAMALGLEDICSNTVRVSGAVVVPAPVDAGGRDRIGRLAGNHPIPGLNSEASTAELMRMIGDVGARHFVFLVSGGASSLLAAPIKPVTLEEKRTVTELLLRSGAEIGELNIVRKHISSVKGGRLLRLIGGRPATTLILSDVIGDDPATIGSGPSVPDVTSYADAIAVLERYGLVSACPPTVREVLRQGVRGEIAETVRPADPEGRSAVSVVIGSNKTARAAAADEAARLGYAVSVRPEPLVGETASCARNWFAEVISAGPPDKPTCHIAGGETTVRVTGTGKGGRNQEFALALVEELRDRRIEVLSVGTDGVDGPTDAAGAFVDGDTYRRARRAGLDPASYLANNDSHTFFRLLGDLLSIGPTGTNVMDLKISLIWPASAA